MNKDTTESGVKSDKPQRVIKFRAWDKVAKQMSPEFSLFGEFLLVGAVFSWQREIRPEEPLDSLGMLNDLEVMQFTGLTDKEGTEIYEGDIVRFVGGTCSFLPCGIYASDVHPIGTTLVVDWLPSGFTLRREKSLVSKIPNLVGNVNNYDFWNHHRSLEVIGNIYQNKKDS